MAEAPAPRNRGSANRRPPQRQAPGPLLALMGTTIIIFLVLALATGEWVFVFLGLFGLAAGLVPILDRRD